MRAVVRLVLVFSVFGLVTAQAPGAADRLMWHSKDCTLVVLLFLALGIGAPP